MGLTSSPVEEEEFSRGREGGMEDRWSSTSILCTLSKEKQRSDRERLKCPYRSLGHSVGQYLRPFL